MSNFARTIRVFAATTALAVSVAAAPLFVGDAMAADVEGVEIIPGEDTRVYIYMTEGSDGAAVSTFSMTDPHRIIVDIADVRAVDGLEEMSGEGGLIDEVLVSTIEDEADTVDRDGGLGDIGGDDDLGLVTRVDCAILRLGGKLAVERENLTTAHLGQ